jgi:hypothetical protein
LRQSRSIDKRQTALFLYPFLTPNPASVFLQYSSLF